jgi:octaprenyl-diphosphate synthase
MKWTLDSFTRTLTDLSEGEMLQQQKAFTSDTTMEDYLRIIYCKTGSLFVTACESGAKSVKASEEMIEAAGRYGKALGLAFQIRDDILDYAGGETTGKPVGIDLLEQKITQPLLCALESVSGEEAMAVRKKVVSISDNPALAEEVRAFVLAHDGVAKAEAVLDYYIEKAIKTLQPLPTSAEKSYLAKLSLFVGARDV